VNATSTMHVDPADATVNGVALYSVELAATFDREWFESQVPDPAWSHTDDAGHFHAYDSNGKLPTLRKTFVNVGCDGTCGGVCDGEGFNRATYECVLCDSLVEPATRRGSTPVGGSTTYTAEVSGPLDLAGFDGEEVSFTCSFGFGRGGLIVREVTQSSDFDRVHASVELGILHRRLGTQAQRESPDLRRKSVARAILAGAEAIRKPWESLSEADRVEFLNDFATLAAGRAITAALPLLGLDENGEFLLW
jgi:hypothetical protein